MMPLRRLFVLVTTGLLVGCSAHVRPVVATRAPVFPPGQSPANLPLPKTTLALDPALVLIGRAEAELKAGESELAQGHRLAACERFDADVGGVRHAIGRAS